MKKLFLNSTSAVDFVFATFYKIKIETPHSTAHNLLIKRSENENIKWSITFLIEPVLIKSCEPSFSYDVIVIFPSNCFIN